MSARLAVGLVAWAAGCTPAAFDASEPSADPEPSANPEPNTAVESPRRDLAGQWIFDQPTHALYEAVLFDFRRDGTLARLGEIRGGVDRVEHGPVGCTFGDRWASPRVRTLAIEGTCSDDRSRTIELSLSGEALGRHEVTEIRVAGESGWTHRGHAWSVIRCPDPDGGCAWEEYERASPHDHAR